MDYPINSAEPLVMHIDLNSAFASIEQQANRMLRGVPVGVAANLSPGGCVISPSKEAKVLGVKVGFRVRDAQALIPNIRIIAPDPDKYFYVHKQFSRLFRDYSPDVVPLSIDEAAINFKGTLGIHRQTMEEIGQEIKDRMRDEIGDWLTCNVGISTNRFLAKLAAGLHKPNGLDVITHDNLRDVLGSVGLMDLCGINTRNKTRLHLNGITSPLEFLDAPVWKLWKEVFHSVNGRQWFLRLRGWEVDDITYKRRTYGQSYALHHFTNNTEELSKLMMKLCEKMGRRLRRSGNFAYGIHVGCGYRGFSGWHKGQKGHTKLYSTQDLYNAAMKLLEYRPQAPFHQVTHIWVNCYGLQSAQHVADTLFETEESRAFKLADAMDAINNRYGEYTVHAATMSGMDEQIIKRVPFHATTDTLSEIYDDSEEFAGVA